MHFNIGVAAYRLGQYSRAAAAFREVARTPQTAALAHYNLGLVALRSGDQQAALRWFLRAEEKADDAGLRRLIAAQLVALYEQQPARSWIGYGALLAGYDDNVALISDSGVLGVSGTEDGFVELQLAAGAPLERPWRLDAGLLLIDYQDLDSFDQLSAHGGARYRIYAGDWTNEIGVQLAHTLLDSEGFENKATLALQASAALSQHWQLRARYRFNAADGLNEFDALSGQRHEIAARLAWTGEPWSLGIEYRFDVNDYQDEALSNRRHQLGVDVECTLPGRWLMSLEATQQRSRYDVRRNGDENRTELALATARILSPRWRLVVRYAYADNQADLAEFDYRRRRISAGVEATF